MGYNLMMEQYSPVKKLWITIVVDRDDGFMPKIIEKILIKFIFRT